MCSVRKPGRAGQAFLFKKRSRNRSIRDCQKRPSGEWSGLVRRVGSWGFRSLFLKKNRARSQPPTQLRRVHSSWLIYIFRGIVKESHASENEDAGVSSQSLQPDAPAGLSFSPAKPAGAA